jgi:ribonuclease HII
MKNFDNAFLSENIRLIAGIDEAGRGPLAGPVVAASVVFDPCISIARVNDSKKLSEALREELYLEITGKALRWSVGIVSHLEIDRINILQATMLAMKNSLESLSVVPDLAIIDGNKVFPSRIPSRAIVKGDGKSFCIAAASIVAKVTRDRMMKELSAEYPEYMWHKNKGYGTSEHIKALRQFGPSPFHRKTFLKNFLMEENEPGI